MNPVEQWSLALQVWTDEQGLTPDAVTPAMLVLMGRLHFQRGRDLPPTAGPTVEPLTRQQMNELMMMVDDLIDILEFINTAPVEKLLED